jgi:hypothetical protein
VIARLRRLWCYLTARHRDRVEEMRSGGLVWERCRWCGLLVPVVDGVRWV